MFIGTTDILDSDGEFDSGTYQTDGADRITGSVYSDQSGNIYIEQSGDGSNWDVSTTYAISADDGKGFSEELLLPYVRVRYVNDSTDQTAFRLRARFNSAGRR